MDFSTPGFPVHRQLPELAQTHVHWVGDAIQPSHPFHPLLLLPSVFPSIRVFSNESFISDGQTIGASLSASVLPMNIQDWFPLGLTGLIALLFKGLFQESFPTPQFKKHQFFHFNFIYDPTLTPIHDYWKNHSFDCTDLCWRSNVSAF